MKSVLSISGAVLFVLGFAMITGVEQNPIQAVYALICMGAACVCFNRAERLGKREKTGQVYNYQRRTYKDAA